MILNVRLVPTSLKLRVLPSYPSSIIGQSGITVAVANGVAGVTLDYTKLIEIFSFDPTQKLVAVYDPVAQAFNVVALSDLINNAGTIVQIATAAGDIAVLPNTQLLVVNRAADVNPSNIILPLASLKVGKVKIVDFKGNAGAFPHTLKTQGADTFQGGAVTWGLDGNGASVVADPISGTGYAI